MRRTFAVVQMIADFQNRLPDNEFRVVERINGYAGRVDFLHDGIFATAIEATQYCIDIVGGE